MQFFSNGGSGDFIFLKPAPSSFGNTTNLLLHAPTTNNNDYVVQETLPATLYNKNLLDNTNNIAASYLQTSNIWQPIYIKENTPSAANQVLITSNTTSAQWSYIPNSAIFNPFVEIITGNSLQGGGNVVLGDSITLSHIDSTVNLGHYGSSTKVPVFTVNQQGHITYSSNIDISPITINALDGLNGGGTVYPNQSINISIDVPVNANIGGTGITSYLVGDLLYASATTTLSKLNSVPTGNVLRASGTNTAPNWGKVGLNTHTDGVLESSKGGTGTNNNYNITLSGSLTTGGSFTTNNAISFNTSAPSTLTLPTSGTVATTTTTSLPALSEVNTITTGTWAANTISAIYGGTGLTNYATGDLLYASSSTTLSKLSSSIIGNALISQGTNTAPVWGKIPLQTSVTGVLSPSQGGTGIVNTNTITLGGDLTTTGSFPLTITTTGSTNITLPTSGTLINSDVNTLNSLSAVGTISSGTWSATPIAANKGGTGQSSYTIGDILYASGVTTLSKINAVGTGNVLISGGIGTAPSWGKVNLATSLSGITSVSNGGTGTNTLTSGNFLIGAGTNSVDTSKVAPSGTVVGTTDTQILTNKTLTSPVISTISNTGTLTLPTSTDTLVGRDTTDTLTNKSLNNTNCFHIDNADNTKKIAFSSNFATTGTTLTLGSTATTNKIILFPDVTDIVVTLAAAQTLSSKTLATPFISSILNTGLLTLPTLTDTLVGRATTDTLTNKTLTDSTTFFQDEIDNTKKLQFQLSGITTGTTRTLTIPDTNDTLVTLALAQTLTNKTLTTPIISSISNTGTLTLPTSTDTLVGRATTDTLTNKTLTDNTTFFQDEADNSKKLQFQLSGITTATTRTLTIPNTSDTLVTLALAQTLTNKTLTDSTTFFQDEADNSKKLQFQLSGITTATTRTLTIPNTSDTLVTLALAQTLTNKTLTTPIISSISNTGTLTLPTSTDTLVGRATTDTLTNKTLTSPIISTISNTGTLTLPTSTDTLVGRATTDTLTNKTLTGSSNTIAASQLRTTGSDVVISGAAAPSTGQVLTATSATTAAWQNIIIYRCEVYNTYGGAFSIGAGSTTVTWNSVTSDIYSMFNGSTTITVPVAGVYGIEVGHFMTQTNPSNNIQVLFLKVNGVTVASDYIDYSAVTTYIGQANLAATYYCAANDPIIVTTNTGIYSAFGVNNTVTRFRVTRLT